MCPTKGKKVANAYVYSYGVSSLTLGEIIEPSGTLLTMDGQHAATTSPVTYDNVAYTIDDVDARHSNKFVCTFADGHVDIMATTPDKLPIRSSLVLWLKADSFTALADGDAVTNWNDFSSKGNHFTAPGTASLPVYKQNVINNGTMPAIRFSVDAAGNGRMQSAGTFTPREVESLTLIAALAPHAATPVYSQMAALFWSNGSNTVDWGTTGGSHSFFWNTSDALTSSPYAQYLGNGFWALANTATGGSYGVGNVNVFAVELNPTAYVGAVARVWTDGKIGDTVSLPAGHEMSTTRMWIGTRWSGGAYHNQLNGDMAEMLMFVPAISDLEQGLVTNYLKKKWTL
jgi:prepilin-type processing-associated H-X9-DG protein